MRYRQQRNILVPTLSQPVPSFRWKSQFYQCFSACVGTTDVWSRSSFWVTTCMFFSADVGKTIDRVLTTHALQTVIKLSFAANGSESFRVHCFACWISPEVILFSGSFHLLQDPGYRVWSLASHTKCSVSAGTWYWRLYFLLVRGKHLLVKNGICRSSGGSGLDMQTIEEKSGSWHQWGYD